MSGDRCAWCGQEIEADDGFRAFELPGERRAAFCRLEHVVPWAIQGPHWEPGAVDEPAALGSELADCARCGTALGDVRVLLVHHRGEHRIADGFCSMEHMRQWAGAGGRWG